MNTTANALLALGASPVMAHAEEEVGEMTAIARALVLNIGTLSGPWIASMFRRAPRQKEFPADRARSGRGGRDDVPNRNSPGAAEKLSPAIVRGNASEILALVYNEQSTRGVDSAHGSEAAAAAAGELSARYNRVAVVSGAVDLICRAAGRAVSSTGTR